MNAYDTAFRDFPSDKFHYMYIDLDRALLGRDCFDVNEPGYARAMENAFLYVRGKLGTQFNSCEFWQLHCHCVMGVKHLEDHLNYRDQSYLVSYGIEDEGICQKAWEELDSTGLINYVEIKNRCVRQYPLLSEKVTEIVDHFFSDYYEGMERALKPKEKLSLIVTLCRALEVFHAFKDGNQRTIAFALLTKLLIENGFSPAILETPYMFDGYYPVKTMVYLVKKGMKRFEHLKNNNPLDEADRRFIADLALHRDPNLFHQKKDCLERYFFQENVLKIFEELEQAEKISTIFQEIRKQEVLDIRVYLQSQYEVWRDIQTSVAIGVDGNSVMLNSPRDYRAEIAEEAIENAKERNIVETFRLIRQIPKSAPEYNKTLSEIACCFLQNDLFAEALYTAEKIVVDTPERLPLFENIAHIFLEKGKPAYARHLIEKVSALFEKIRKELMVPILSEDLSWMGSSV